MQIEKYISPLIASQFPAFYRDEGPNFIAFVQAYYEWMEQTGNVLDYSRSMLQNTDIDFTTQQFLQYFKNEFVSQIPSNVVVDKRMLIKHIIELYQSKGTRRAYALLFRLVFNEDIDIYIPGDNLFKPSQANWKIPKYIEISDSEFLPDLVGKQIRSATSTAIVENYFTKYVNNKVVNVLYISNLVGRFKFGDKVYCDDLYVDGSGNTITYREYSLLSSAEQAAYMIAINNDNVPILFGSLSAVGIINGGVNFAVGDLLPIYGTGSGGIAKVTSVRNENGKVTFKLIDGGFGFSVNAVVTIVGGGGAGATFKVGTISNKAIYQINTDIINNYIETQLDVSGSGFNLNIADSTGTMTVGEQVTSSANVVVLDVQTTAGFISNNDIISNTDLGITDLRAYHSDGSLIYVTGPESSLTSANLVAGVTLANSTNLIIVNTVFPKTTISGNGTAVTANSSVVYVDNVNGYFVPQITITGETSGYTSNVITTDRLTNWEFPNAVDISNLDVPTIGNTLRTYDLEVGTITSLSGINPGVGYSASPTVTVVEPQIYNLQLDDGKGGYYGYDAQITSKAGIAAGVATSVFVEDAGFGYNTSETLTIPSPDGSSSITGTAIIDLNGVGSGYWTDNAGFLSDLNYLEDSNYYQKFSYEVVAKRMLSTYQRMVLDLIHPSGVALFGKFVNKNEMLPAESSPIYFSLSQS